MRMGFSVVVCALLAMAWWAEAAPVETCVTCGKLLFQAIRLLSVLQPTIQETGTRHLHSPTTDIEECCYKSALQCFSSQLSNITTKKMDQKEKLRMTLLKSMHVKCDEEMEKKAMCKPCESYVKVDSKDFLKNLLSLLQKSSSRLPANRN